MKHKLHRNEKYVKNPVISLLIPSRTHYLARSEYLHQLSTISRKENEREFFSHLKHFKTWATTGLSGRPKQPVWTAAYPFSDLFLKENVKECLASSDSLWTQNSLFSGKAEDYYGLCSPLKKSVLSLG